MNLFTLTPHLLLTAHTHTEDTSTVNTVENRVMSAVTRRRRPCIKTSTTISRAAKHPYLVHPFSRPCQNSTDINGGEFRGDSHVAARAQPDAIARVFRTTGLPCSPGIVQDASPARNDRIYQYCSWPVFLALFGICVSYTNPGQTSGWFSLSSRIKP